MSAPILTIDDPTDSVLNEHVHTLTLVQADPLAASLQPTFEALITDHMNVTALRVNLVIAIAKASAKAIYVDVQLNDIVDQLVAALQKVTKKNRKDPLWSVFLGNQDPSAFKRPILRGQLKAMRVWPASLTASAHDELKDIAPKLAALLPSADSAEQELAASKQALVTFDSVGAWADHITKSNAERQAAWGFLSQLPHNNPALKLSNGFADLFFLHDTSRRGASAPRTSKDIADDIAALENKLAPLKAELEAAIVAEKKAEEDAANEAALRTALALAEKEREEADAKAEALRKQLEKGSKGKA